MKKTVIVTALAALLGCQAHAADIAVTTLSNGEGLLYVGGEILAGDDLVTYRKLAEWALDHPKKPPSKLALDSQGGDFRASLGIATIVAKMQPLAFVPITGTCTGSCFYIFASTKQRAVITGGRVGVSPVTNAEGDETSESMGLTVGMAALLKSAAGVPDNVFAKLAGTPVGKTYWLNDEDLAAMDVDRAPKDQ